MSDAKNIAYLLVVLEELRRPSRLEANSVQLN
jgi:hypothetical protein